MGRTFMPSRSTTRSERPTGSSPSAAPDGRWCVDFHAEATSEKQAIAWYLDGRVAAVVGTHTHVPTADARLLPGGTAMVTDLGMVGARDSIIGDDVSLGAQPLPDEHADPLPVATGNDVVFNSVLIDIDEARCAPAASSASTASACCDARRCA